MLINQDETSMLFVSPLVFATMQSAGKLDLLLKS